MKKWYHKIDGRHTGHGQWRYFVVRPQFHQRSGATPFENKQLYYQWYAWCWETWGPSKNIGDWYADIQYDQIRPEAFAHNEHWCWESTEIKDRIFFRTDNEFSLFLLRWE